MWESGINNTGGGIYNPLPKERKKGEISEQYCHRGEKRRKPRSGGPRLLCKAVGDAIPEMLRRGSEAWATERRGSRHKLLHRATRSGSGEKAMKDGVSADQRRSSLGC